jgi:tetratricopeptide (TPR) repeat protein
LPDSLTDGAQRRLDALRARLDTPQPESANEAMREEITWLKRDLERQRDLIGKLLDDSDALLKQMTHRPRSHTPAGAPEFLGERPTPSSRADKLGASTFIEKGWNLISASQFADAETALRKALSLAADDMEALALLGWAQMYQEKYDDALLTFQGVLVRQPDSSIARINIGYICLKKKIFGEAIEHLSRVIRGNSDRKSSLYANYYLGLLYFEREMFEDAKSFFLAARTLGPNLIEASFELGRAFWFNGEREEAKQAWREGFAANKFSPWGKRCAEMLEVVEKGGHPTLSR